MGDERALIQALWRFIEDVPPDDPTRTDKFFALRERIRDYYGADNTALPNVVIVMEGGIVQEVLTSEPARIAVIDYDTEAAEPESLCRVPQTDGTTVQAYAFTTEPSVIPKRTAELLAAIGGSSSYQNET